MYYWTVWLDGFTFKNIKADDLKHALELIAEQHGSRLESSTSIRVMRRIV